MTRRESTPRQRTVSQRTVTQRQFQLLGVLVLANVVICVQPFFLESSWMMAAVAIPQAQCSIAAMWSVLSSANRFLRFAMTPIVLVSSWFVLIQLLPWSVMDHASAAWAILLTVQCAGVAILMKLYRIGATVFRREEKRHSELRFDLMSVLIWTTLVAGGFGVAQLAQIKLGWSSDIATWQYFKAMPVLAISNALLAVVWYGAFDKSNRMRGSSHLRGLLPIMVAAGLSFGLAWLTQYLADKFSGSQSMQWRSILVVVATQSGVLAITSAWFFKGLESRKADKEPGNPA